MPPDGLCSQGTRWVGDEPCHLLCAAEWGECASLRYATVLGLCLSGSSCLTVCSSAATAICLEGVPAPPCNFPSLLRSAPWVGKVDCLIRHSPSRKTTQLFAGSILAPPDPRVIAQPFPGPPTTKQCAV